MNEISKLFENTEPNADNSSELPLKCYELLLPKSPQEQNQLYSILSAVCKYKEIRTRKHCNDCVILI